MWAIVFTVSMWWFTKSHIVWASVWGNSHSISRLCLVVKVTGMSDLASEWVRLAPSPIWQVPSRFQVRFQYILGSASQRVLKCLSEKVSRFVPFWPNVTHFGAKSDILESWSKPCAVTTLQTIQQTYCRLSCPAEALMCLSYQMCYLNTGSHFNSRGGDDTLVTRSVSTRQT